MLEQIPAQNFSRRSFFVPYTRLNFTPSRGLSVDAAERDAGIVGDLTQILSILRYLDVADDEMNSKCAGYFDGSWTHETAEIAKAFRIDTSVVVNSHNYRIIGPTWKCPGCYRSKIETVRKSPKSGQPYIRFVVHHDHMADLTKTYRFPATVVCEACNNVDPALKHAIRRKSKYYAGQGDDGVFSHFSFSPSEIYSIFGKLAPNTIHKIKPSHVEAAVDIYDRHFLNGLDGYYRYVDTEFARICKYYEDYIPDFKRPFLALCDIREKVVDDAVRCVVDGQRTKREKISDYDGSFYVFCKSDIPISGFEITEFEEDYVYWATYQP